jgi:hypothetical protein
VTPPLQNVTPVLPPTGGPPPGGTSPPRPRRSGGMLPVIAVVLALAGAFSLFSRHENRYERLATDVTEAIENNDMRPVERRFNALRRPELEDRAKVGALSDFVNAGGKLKRIKEDTPKDASVGYHHFIAEFEKGTRSEDLTLDADGKIAAFHVRPASP